MDVDTRKATALLAYLAATERTHTRDAIATLLWPSYDHTRARASLRRTLSTLSKALGPGRLTIDRTSIRLVTEDAWMDVHEYHRLVAACAAHPHPHNETCPRCVEPLLEAVALHRGEFLAGFSLRDSPEFDDWQSGEADRLGRDLSSTYDRLVSALADARRHDDAIAHAERWLDLDPLNETAYRRLMLLHAWNGNRSAALRRYRACVAVLARELSVEPLEETTALYRAIEEDDAPDAPAALHHTPADHHDVRLAHPMVGRTAELSVLLGAYRQVGVGGRLAIVEGEAGIGKTRLVEELAARIADLGGTVHIVRCYEDEAGMAFGPIADALRGAAIDLERLGNVSDAVLSEASRLAPELAAVRADLPEPPPLTRPGGQARFFQSVGRVLDATLGGAVPGALICEDVQWADDATLDLLRYLVRRLDRLRFLLVVTWRSDGLGERPLGRMPASGWDPVHLDRLDRVAVGELVRAVRLPDRPADLADRLHRETEGLPLFLIEYLTQLADPETASGDLPLPGGVRDVLLARMATLSGPARQVLTTAAVVGRSFDPETVLRAGGRTEEETLQSLDELVASGLIHEVGVTEDRRVYDFVHEKLRELAYDQAGLARQRILHRRVARALREATRPRGAARVAAVIAHHLRLGGHDDEAALAYRRAGDHARRLFANAEALEHYRAALALDHPDPDVLHEAIGDLLTLQGEYGQALVAYEAAAALAEPGPQLGGIEHKIAAVHLRRRDHTTAEAHLDAALAAFGDTDDGARARILADRSLAARAAGLQDAAADRVREALDVAEAAGDTRALAQAHNILGVVARGEGRLDDARHHLEQSLRYAGELADPTARVAALNNLALALGDLGEHSTALEHARTALGVCTMQGDRHRAAAIHNNIADLLRASGRTDDAMSHLKEAASIFAEIGEPERPSPEIWKLVDW